MEISALAVLAGTPELLSPELTTIRSLPVGLLSSQ
jgi:hypothetical protein